MRLLLAAEDAAQRRQVQQVALAGADDQADVGHHQHDEELQKALGRTCADAVADDQAEEVGADDAEDAADDRADQPLQADLAQAYLKQDDGSADQHSNAGCGPALQAQGLQFIAGNCCNQDK